MPRRGHSIQSSMPRRIRSSQRGKNGAKKVAIICTCREYFAGWSTRERNPRRCTKARTRGVVAVVNTPQQRVVEKKERMATRGHRRIQARMTPGPVAGAHFNTYATRLSTTRIGGHRALSFGFMLIYALISPNLFIRLTGQRSARISNGRLLEYSRYRNGRGGTCAILLMYAVFV